MGAEGRGARRDLAVRGAFAEVVPTAVNVPRLRSSPSVQTARLVLA